MGWCSGTDVFDDIMRYVLSPDTDEIDKTKLVQVVIKALEDHDWDCHGDSIYRNDPLVMQVLRELHPDWTTEE